MEERVTTAGAYVIIDGHIPFAVGPTPVGEALAVIRLGGHRERGESSLACAMRELWEEARLAIEPMQPPVTYLAQGVPPELTPTAWSGTVKPLLVIQRAGAQRFNVMYLARSQGQPEPASETRGLLLLDRPAIAWFCTAELTLGQFLAAGGRAMLREEMAPDLPLRPGPQLLLLHRLLAMHPGLLPRT